MAFGNSSSRRLAYVEENSFGVTPPSTPNFQNLRFTGGAGMQQAKQTAMSNEIRPDRNVSSSAVVGIDVNGSYTFEFSYNSYDILLESALSGNWSSDVLINGVDQTYYTFEETFEMGATDRFLRWIGCRVSSLSLDIAARSIVTGTFNIMGRQEDSASTALGGSSYTAVNNNEVMTGSNSVANLNIAGVDPDPIIRRITLDINNGLRTRTQIGSLYSSEYGEDRVVITGTVEAYFENFDLYNKIKNHETGTLSFRLGHETNKKYDFTMPKARLGEGRVNRGGNSDDIMVTAPFTAEVDANLGGSGNAGALKITRAIG